MRGFRRAVAGDVLDLTRDMKLALDWIGDVDLGMGRRYLQPSNPRLAEAATAVDRLLGEIGHRNRHVAVTEGQPPETIEVESVGELEPVALGREDSNLQLHISNPSPSDHASHEDKHLRNDFPPETSEETRKTEPETVPQPSRDSAHLAT